MKIALVYYSLEGNTAFAAEMIGQKLGVDIIRLKPVKDYPTEKIAKYFFFYKKNTFSAHKQIYYLILIKTRLIMDYHFVIY